MSDRVSEMIVKPICLEPFSAACSGGSPASIWREMFSIITMASSTTKPVAMVSAISVRLLIENPARYITANAPISDNGTTTLGMTVAASLRKNRKMTITTSATASSNSKRTSRTDARMVIVRSVSTATSTAAGSDALQLRQHPLDAVDHLDDVGARLALDVEDDCRRLVGPGRQLRVLGAIRTSATSASRTAAPLR